MKRGIYCLLVVGVLAGIADRTYATSLITAEASQEMFFSDSSSSYLTENDIVGMTPKELCYARNEIFARYGRGFNSQELQNYFDAQSWYTKIYTPEEFPNEILNTYDKHNIDLLYSKEHEYYPDGYPLDQKDKHSSVKNIPEEYIDLIHDGIWLNVNGESVLAEGYYLFDFNRDGTDDLFVYGIGNLEKNYSWQVWTKNASGESILIAADEETWFGNAGHSAAISKNGCIKVSANRSLVGYDADWDIWTYWENGETHQLFYEWYEQRFWQEESKDYDSELTITYRLDGVEISQDKGEQIVAKLPLEYIPLEDACTSFYGGVQSVDHVESNESKTVIDVQANTVDDIYQIPEKYDNGVALRTSGSKNADLITRLIYPVKFHADQYDGTWAYTSIDGNTGWIDTDYCEPLGTVHNTTEEQNIEETSYYISDDYKNGIALRSGHSHNTDLIARYPYRTVFNTTLLWGNWAYTTIEGKTGWINLDFCMIDDADEKENDYYAETASSDYISTICDANEMIYIDLDGDGNAEEVTLEIYPDEYGVCNSYRLCIDQDYIDGTGENIESTLYGVSLDKETVWLVVYEYGPSDDPLCTFYKYADGEIQEANSIPDDVDNIVVNDDGSMSCQVPCRVLQTDRIYTTWRADEDGYIWRDSQEKYRFAYTEGREYTLLETVDLYEKPDTEYESLEMEPQQVTIPYTDEWEEWVYLEGEDGQSGWLYCGDDVRYDVMQYFEGLFLAD